MSLGVCPTSGDGTPVSSSATPSDSSRKPYGQTCAECARGKVKCSLPSADGRCQRCHRLDKRCTPSTTKRQLKPASTRKSTQGQRNHETSRMEQKLEELMSLLKPPPPNAQPQTQLPANSLSAHSTRTDLEVSVPELEPVLAAFRERLQYLPFVDLPLSVTAHEMIRSRPYLSLAIVAVETKHPVRQIEVLTRLRRVLADQLICLFHSSLDLLEGVLAFLGWFMYLARSGDESFKGEDTFRSATCTLSQLAVAIVYDLGLNKPSPSHQQTATISLDFGPVAALDASSDSRGDGAGRPERADHVRTLRERRVVLGCFLLTSIVSTAIKRIDSLRWTQHMGECLRELECAKACPLDVALVQHVKAQLVVEKAALAGWYDKTLGSGDSPTHVYAQALHAELLTIESAAVELQPTIRRTTVLHCRAARFAVNDMAVTGISTAGPLSLATLRLLNDCVETIHHWSQTFLEYPASEYPRFSIVTLNHLKQHLGAAFALCTLTHPAWDRENARERLDPVGTIARVTENYTEASKLDGLPQDRSNIFWRVANVMRMTQQMWVAKLGPGISDGDGLATDGFDFASLGDMNELDLFAMDWLSGFN